MAAGRPKIFDEKEAIRKTAKLFWKKGYAAAGTEDLLKVMNLGRGSLYHNFGSKDNLFKMSISQFLDDTLTQLRQEAAKVNNPMEFVKEFFRAIASADEQVHHLGCFLGNAMAELSNVNPELESYAADKQKKFEEFFYECALRAKELGFIKTEPKLLARHLLNLWNGINITRRMYPEKKELLPVINFNLQLIE